MSHPTLKDGYHTSNVFLLIQDAFAKNMEAIDEGTSSRYEEEGLLDQQYQASLDKWQSDASQLPEAGKKGDVDASHSINGAGIATLLISGVVGGLIATAALLGALGVSTSWTGIGLIFIAMAAVIIGIALLIMYKTDAGKNGPCMTEIAGYTNYDQGAQNSANSLVQRDQSLVQQLQNAMNKLMSQYINPANDTKSQDANMIQGAIQWMKAMVWSQGAA